MGPHQVGLRMHLAQVKIEGLCAERDRLMAQQGGSTKERVLGGKSW